MKFYQFMQIGQSHTNHCEDYCIVENYAKNKTVCAVMDGCSMGNESHFASELTGKVLRKIAKELYYEEFVKKTLYTSDLKSDLQHILKLLMSELKVLKNKLLLAKEDLLSTLVLAIIDQVTGNMEVVVIGDGVVCIDGKIFDFEQNNIPDYLGYHLGDDFEVWYNSLNQRISRDYFSDLSLSSDGIFTFQSDKGQEDELTKIVIDYFLIDKDGADSVNMLRNKFQLLVNKRKIHPIDDLGMIRIIK